MSRKELEKEDLDVLMEMLPNRFISHPFDFIFKLNISKKDGMWEVVYLGEGKSSGRLHCFPSIDLKLAVIGSLISLNRDGVPLGYTGFKLNS